MPMSESASTTDVLAAIATAGLGSVAPERRTSEYMPHDDGKCNSSAAFLPISSSDAHNHDVGRSDVAQRRDEREEGASGVRKLRRLSAKTCSEQLVADVWEYEQPQCSRPELVASHCSTKVSGSNDRPLARREYNRLVQLERRLVFNNCVKPSLLAKGWPESDVLAVLDKFKMSDYADTNLRVALLKEYCSSGGGSKDLRQLAQRRVAAMTVVGDDDSSLSPCRPVTGTAFLATFNGDWGVVSEQIERDAINDLESFVAYLRGLAKVQALWNDALRWVQVAVATVGAAHWSLSLEVCLDTLQVSNLARLHLHSFFEGVKDSKKSWKCDQTSFKGERGFFSNPHGTRRPWRNVGQGHYYLAMPKLGKVHWASSRSPYKGKNAYSVNPEWITQALQGGKITFGHAKSEYIKCCRNVSHNLQNLERLCLENRQTHVLARASAVKFELEKERRPSKRYALVDAWLEAGRACRRRYRFLVIEGPSCVGKTQYVLNLFGHDSCIETNCSSAPEPDLREFDSTKHRAILFDEATCSLVLRNKKLFQASASFVQLGCSMTNCHKYEIWAHQTYMVVTSNTWSAELSMLPAQGDKDWLTVNSVHLMATDVMYL